MNVQQKAYGLETRVSLPYVEAVERTRAARGEERRGLIAEIELR